LAGVGAGAPAIHACSRGAPAFMDRYSAGAVSRARLRCHRRVKRPSRRAALGSQLGVGADVEPAERTGAGRGPLRRAPGDRRFGCRGHRAATSWRVSAPAPPRSTPARAGPRRSWTDTRQGPFRGRVSDVTGVLKGPHAESRPGPAPGSGPAGSTRTAHTLNSGNATPGPGRGW